MEDSEIISYVTWWLGNLTEDEMSSEDMQKLMDMVNLQHTDATDCQKYYYLAVATLQFLIRMSSKGLVGSTSTGAVTQREEERGETRISVSYSDSDTQASWETILADLIDTPDSIGCQVNEEVSSVASSVIIGVSKCRFDPVAPWRQNLITPTRKLW